MRFRRQSAEIAPGVEQMHPRWEGILRGDSPFARAQRIYRRTFALFPSPWRCKFCNAPFRGPYSGALKWIGYTPSAKNPNICAR
jgi:adenylate cyclase